MERNLRMELLQRLLGTERPAPGSEIDAVCRVLRALPYENLSKFRAWLIAGRSGFPFRGPETVAADHLAHGLGGTCFSLVRLAGELLAEMGVASRAVTATMMSGGRPHAGLIIRDPERGPLLIDPGYLLPGPIPLRKPGAGDTPSRYRLEQDGREWILHVDGRSVIRFHLSDTSETRFLQAWRDSFPSMKDLVLARRREDTLLYARNRFIRITGRGGREQERTRHYGETISRLFAIERSVVEEVSRMYQQEMPWKKLIPRR